MLEQMYVVEGEGVVISAVCLGTYDGYVYDLETADCTFCVESGAFVAKNTDSIYTIFRPPVEKDDPGYIKAVFEMAEKAANEISLTFPKPVQLEFEKVMWPFLLYSKKRYSY